MMFGGLRWFCCDFNESFHAILLGFEPSRYEEVDLIDKWKLTISLRIIRTNVLMYCVYPNPWTGNPNCECVLKGFFFVDHH